MNKRWLVHIAVATWIVLFFALCGRTLFLKVDRHSVFPVFTMAGESWLHGRLLYIRGGTEEFRYSPIVAAFFTPFAMLPLKVAEFLWRSLNFLTFVGGLLYCCRIGVPRKMSACQVAAIFLLCIPLAMGSLNNAQSNPLVLGLMLIAIAAVVEMRWWVCAIAITIATAFKLYPIALGLLLVLEFPWKLSGRLIICLLIAALLPFALQHSQYVIDQYRQWAHYLVSEDRQRGPISDWYRDFRALWRVYVVPMRPGTYFIIELATAMLIAAVCVRAHWRKIPLALLLGYTFSLACCWMTVMGPATESATYILLAPTVGWGLVFATDSRVRRIAYCIIFGLFFASQVALNVPNGKHFRDCRQPLPLAGLMLLITELICSAQDARGRTDQTQN